MFCNAQRYHRKALADVTTCSSCGVISGLDPPGGFIVAPLNGVRKDRWWFSGRYLVPYTLTINSMDVDGYNVLRT
ncbi:MAG: hypothetical protein V4482_04105 [Pseudomonadota bacterium]